MQTQSNNNESFINFWEFLEIPMNSPTGSIKVAFAKKFEKIENSINSGENIYSHEDLKTCITAYETLSNSYSRYLHNCEIDGEEPPKDPDWDTYFSEDGISDEDLDEESNEDFLAWILSKASQKNIKIENFVEIAKRLYELFIKEKEKHEKKKTHQVNKKTMHN